MNKPIWLNVIEQRLIIRNFTQNESISVTPDSNSTFKNAYLFAELTQKYNNLNLEFEQKKKLFEKYDNLKNTHQKLLLECMDMRNQNKIQKKEIESLTKELKLVSEENRSRNKEISDMNEKHFKLITENNCLNEMLKKEKEDNKRNLEKIALEDLKEKTEEKTRETHPELLDDDTILIDKKDIYEDEGVVRKDSVPPPRRGKFGFIAHAQDINWIQCASAHPYFATASVDKTVCVWNLNTGKRITQLLHFESSTTALAFSRNDTLLGVAQHDGTACVYGIPGGVFNTTEMQQRQHHHQSNTITSSSTAATATNTTTTTTTKHHELKFKTRCHLKPVTCVAFGRDGIPVAGKGGGGGGDGGCQEFLTASRDCTVKAWDIQRTQELYHLDAGLDLGGCYSMTLLPSGIICTGHFSGAVRLWDPYTQMETDIFRPFKSTVITGVTISPNGHHLFIVGKDNQAVVFDLKARKNLVEMVNGRFVCTGPYAKGMFSPCGRYACVGTQGGILTWDLVEKKEGFIDTSHDHGVGEPVLGISYRYDGANIVSYDRKRKVAIWI